MSRHLLIVCIGPVQYLIASARRCQDLWFGSYLLSALARETARAVDDVAGGQSLVFPAALGNDKPSVANKIVAVLPDGVAPERAGNAGRTAMERALRNYAEDAFTRVGANDSRRAERFDEELARAQVDELMELQWVAVPVGGDADYARARGDAEALLARRKHTRDWHSSRAPARTGRRKSALDGQWESALDESLFADVEAGRLAVEDLRRDYHVRRRERLCGIGLLKRVGETTDLVFGERPRPAFRSTSHLAAGPTLVRLAREAGARERVDHYLDEIDRLGVIDRHRIARGDVRGYEAVDPVFGTAAIRVEAGLGAWRAPGRPALDGRLLYEARLRDREDGFLHVSDEELRGLERRLREVLGGRTPVPYYGLLIADGDRMGKAIDALADLDAHRRLSTALEDFAREATKLVEGAGGCPVYAGGDDVLALLPLHTALDAATELAQAFARTTGHACSTLAEKPTLSVGLAVVHHLQPMNEARAVAVRAERLAKRERNSLGIIVAPRSGAELQATGTWGEAPALPARIYRHARLFDEGRLPGGLAYDLERASDLVGCDGDLLASLVGTELTRSRAGRGAEPLAGEDRAWLKDRITAVGARALSGELQIARVFLSAYREAWR
ncbi:MAG: type III-B CRISPR-associated protein Cas10/Cmr2 [Deltaproteobacteria bacterium]|nr:type III-B CRISPR-associated protein Cas10/Cmr2 [Deltaproteobacteria bacterium]